MNSGQIRRWVDKMRRPVLACVGVFFAGYSPTVFAYIDPGAGSMLVTVIIGALATALYMFKGFYYRVAKSLFALTNRKFVSRNKHGIVIYSEGRQYWNTFKPVLSALDRRGLKVIYLTSDEGDAGLQYVSDNIDAKFIKKGNAAFTTLNMLEADICVTTTPGLDVLHFRRSKGVQHYAHLVHAPTTGTYKLFSFDYFDSVLCSGPHQIEGIRELEQLRGLRPKKLLETGCAYMDVLAEKFDRYNDQTGPSTEKMQTILVAPSWGNNALLHRFGAALISPLLQYGFNVIIRPHPQSLEVEQALLERVKSELGNNPQLSWDLEADGFESMRTSVVMISDLSGIVFDYAFIFEKPVITVKFDLDLRGLDANHLSEGLWEVGMLEKIGKQIGADELASLPQIVEELLANTSKSAQLSRLRDEHVFNYRTAGEVAAAQIQSILSEISVA
jgi:CDP-glycerol glycerophosphotransferase (TagB/SpsB family)